MSGAYYLEDHQREDDLAINSTTPASTGPLPQGEYTVYCPEMVDFFVSTGATWGSGKKQRVIPGNMPELIVPKGSKIWGKTETGTATLEICKVRNNIYY